MVGAKSIEDNAYVLNMFFKGLREDEKVLQEHLREFINNVGEDGIHKALERRRYNNISRLKGTMGQWHSG